MAAVLVYLLLFLFLNFLDILHSVEENKNSVEKWPGCSFDCGKLGTLMHPFVDIKQPLCEGLFPISGCNETVQKVQLNARGDWYKVEEITLRRYQPITLTIHDRVLLRSSDCEFFFNLTLSDLHFLSYRIISYITLLNCDTPPNITLTNDFQRTTCYNNRDVYYRMDNEPTSSATDASDPSLSQPPPCSTVQHPLRNLPTTNYSLLKRLPAKLTVEMKGKVNCSVCTEGPCQLYCPKRGLAKGDVMMVSGILSAGILGVMIIPQILRCSVKFSRVNGTFSGKTYNSKSIEAFLGYNLAVKRYSFKDVKRITNKLADKLGEGGFGSVYKGMLPDGRQVAVKVLKEAKDHGESFINEVASISRTSHVNVVSLLGFCFEGHKQALIYEFMVNGSLEKFIYQDKHLLSSSEHLQLRWETLYQIAVGIARGIEYLHRGCTTRILHFDIKPHNILLDDDFCPKISDFGLAKLCSRKESIISMTGARGTVGYIAPEVFSRNFGGVSHKSDVYSYGMMIMDMVGGRKNNNVKGDCSSEMYFPHWMYKRLELDEAPGSHAQSIVNNEEDDKQIARKMIIVGLWCIQTNPSKRPPMSRVLQMLEGTLESLEIPPKPCLSSPPRLPPDTGVDSSSTLSLIT